MARRKSEQKTSYWREVLARQAESGLSIRQFCIREGVSQPSFYAWRRKLPEPRPKEPGTGASRRGSDTAAGGREFISLRLVDTASSLEVIHPRGCRIRITGAVDTKALRCVLAALDAEEQA